MTDAAPALIARMTLGREGGARIGGERVALLRAIDRHGSIAAAARETGISYKAAWDAVTALNNLFARPVVEAAPGGLRGGGARLTLAGRGLLDGYGRIDAAMARAMEALDGDLSAGAAAPLRLMRALGLGVSARNLLGCEAVSLTTGPVSCAVRLRLTGGQALTAVVTRESVAEMGLVPGAEVFALIKANFITLAAADVPLRLSACNALRGTVARREEGPVNASVALDLGGGKTLTAVVTTESAEAMDLVPGREAVALFKASHVILAAA